MSNEKKPTDPDVPERHFKGRETAYRVLHRVLHGGAYSNVVLANVLQSQDLTTGDRRIATFLVYGVLRNLDLLDAVFRSKSSKGKITAAPALLLIARMAIFEILFQKKVPAYATISEYMKMARNNCSKQESKFLNACLRRVDAQDVATLLDAIEDDPPKLSLEFSTPEWFIRSLLKFLGRDETVRMLKANNLEMPSYYRINTIRISEKELMEKFETHHLTALASPWLKGCFSFNPGQSYFLSQEYAAGWITPQDISTQIIAHAVNPEPGESILDLCCGRGTKTAHLAELMDNRGRILACDIHAHKIDLVNQEAARLGIHIVDTLVADLTAPQDLGLFDRVLVDTPCSGTGTLRRRPEIKQRLRPADVAGLMRLQRRLLDNAALHVKPGGRLVYATCSVLPEENDDVVAEFLERNEQFTSVRATEPIASIPRFATPFGNLFLPHQVQACGSGVYIMEKKP